MTSALIENAIVSLVSDTVFGIAFEDGKKALCGEDD